MTREDPTCQGAALAASVLAPRPIRVVSLFSGIGGLDHGLELAGAEIVEMCESWEPARRVLRAKFAGVPIASDVRGYLPQVSYDLLAAGFPCVDLSHAGRQAGIFGSQSGLVTEIFRIVSETQPNWILLENVPNLLRLGRGAGIRFIIDSLEQLGYAWAYRVLDSRAFGVPQRRNRVIVLASKRDDPAQALLAQDTSVSESEEEVAEVPVVASGFYWTEGRRGVGLVANAVPTLKGGSTLGLPSAPAVWFPTAPQGRRIVLPSIQDAEELQGFEREWSAPADIESERSVRWKLVGNAVTVALATWVGQRIVATMHSGTSGQSVDGYEHPMKRPWPDAAYGGPGRSIYASSVSRMPLRAKSKRLDEVVNASTCSPLSFRATKGFLSRIEESGIKLDAHFLNDLESHMAAMRSSISRQLDRHTEASWASSDQVRKRMQRTPQKNTSPELKLRRALTDRGLRYRLQIRPEPSLRWRSDIVFKGPKVVIDVRGCFWHVCPVHQTWPKANAERWRDKLLKNQERDLRMESDLAAQGWVVVVVWEHANPEDVAITLEALVRSRMGGERPLCGRVVTERVDAVA